MKLPDADFKGAPKLTVTMAAKLQGFPETWEFMGGKTAAYRQVGNAFPPPVACEVATKVRKCLEGTGSAQNRGLSFNQFVQHSAGE